jgi:hypothetical protein
VTLPGMLRAERRSNFRDAALQSFGHDAVGKEAFFETLSSEAELCFAQLEPPAPSGLERLARRTSAAAARTERLAQMPDEFMRGGGCFAPDALVRCVDEDDEDGGDGDSNGGSGGGVDRDVPIAALAPGARVRTASGGIAVVRCVVVSPCEGGTATLTALPGGLQLTEWHPLLDSNGKWRFPHMLGERIVRRVPAVYNLLLDREHVAMVGGRACCTLAHGLSGPVIGHPFWGTRAVVDQLAMQPGWASGRVVLEAPLRAPAATRMSVV